MRTRVAIVGTGEHAVRHAEVLREDIEDAEIVAVADTRPEVVAAFGERFGVAATYTDVRQLLAEQRPDIVHICASPRSHRELSVQCLQGGAWVLCEKPLAGSLRDLDVIAAAEASTGRYCASVYQWRCGQAVQHLKRLVEAQALGAPLLGICHTTWYRDAVYYAVPWRRSWASALGGTSMGHGIHAMDMFLWLYGPWKDVAARIDTLDHDIEVEDVSLALVHFENGAYGSIVNSVVSPRQASYLRLDFQQATVEYRDDEWVYLVYEDSPRTADLDTWRSIPAETHSHFGPQFRHYHDCFASGTQPPTSGDGARMTLEFLASLYKSAITGRTVARGSIQPGDPFYDSMNGATVG